MAVVSRRPCPGVPGRDPMGLGISLGLPLALSAAAGKGENPSARASVVATIGYLALLVGPPTLGLLGEGFGLRAAILPPWRW